MGTTTDKTTYLNTTKLKIKDGINRLGGELTNLSTFRSYAEALDSIYDTLPKVSDTGSNLSLTPTLKGGLSTIPLGNCEQDTYTGKNLFNINDRLYGAINSDGDLELPFTTSKFYETNFEENTSYTISAWVKNSSDLGNLRLDFVYTDNTREDVLINNTTNYQFVSNTSNPNKTLASIAGDWGYRGRMYIKDGELMLEKGSTATSYEPYVRWNTKS